MEPIYDSDMDIEVSLENMINWMEWDDYISTTAPDGSYKINFRKFGKDWVSDTKVTIENGQVNVTEALQAAGEVAFHSKYYDGQFVEDLTFVPDKQMFDVSLGS